MHPGRESCAKNTTRATCARVAASASPNPSTVVAIIGTVAGLAVVGSHPNLQKTIQNQCFPLNMEVFSSTSQNVWQEWDAAHTPRERAKCRSRLGAAHMFSESFAPAKARRSFFAHQFVGRVGLLCGLLGPPEDSRGLPGASGDLLWPPGASSGLRRNGARRTPRAKGQNVAFAFAPRTCFLKVAPALLPMLWEDGWEWACHACLARAG